LRVLRRNRPRVSRNPSIMPRKKGVIPYVDFSALQMLKKLVGKPEYTMNPTKAIALASDITGKYKIVSFQ